PKELRVVAGRDVVNLDTQIQHYAADQVSTISAGRDVIFTIERRADNGRVQPNFNEIVIDGPGRLELIAGRNVDLGTSKGVTSQGNFVNANLPQGGADISISAGLAGGVPTYDDFIAAYLEGTDTYDEALEDYVGRLLDRDVTSKADALAAFRGFDR